MWTALLLLGLAQAQEDAPSFTRPDRTAAAFVPVPGFPALLDRDWAGVGLSWAVAAPSTAAVAMISGQAASHPRQAVGMTLAGYYVATVAANRLFSGRALVAVGPTPGYSGISMEVQVAIPRRPEPLTRSEDTVVGRNPYIDAPPPPPPKRAYRLTVRNTGQVIEVDPADLPDDHYDGQRGALLGLLMRAGVEIDHACGGVVGCSTCHIYVEEGFDSAPEPIEEEEDMLDHAPALRDTSRLACQCVPDGSEDVVVEVPAWKRNEVSEDH